MGKTKHMDLELHVSKEIKTFHVGGKRGGFKNITGLRRNLNINDEKMKATIYLYIK